MEINKFWSGGGGGFAHPLRPLRSATVCSCSEIELNSLQAQLHRTGRITSAMRLLHSQTPMEDDRKLSDYSVPEGATISVLIEPDVDINIEVTMGFQAEKFTVSNATSIMVQKVQICGVMKCGVAPERLEIRLEDVTLEDPMPLHFYQLKDGSRLDLIKPYVNVIVENSHENLIFWRLDRKNTIREVKAELATSFSNISTKQLHLFLVSDGQSFHELDDDEEIVKNCNIKDDDEIYLLIYRWTSDRTVKVMETGRKLEGVEALDTCMGIKVKAQHQMGIPFNTIKVARLVQQIWVQPRNQHFPLIVGLGSGYPDYTQLCEQLVEMNDEQLSTYSGPLLVVTEEKLQADRERVKEEEKVWREQIKRM